jgi:hypothetical protein
MYSLGPSNGMSQTSQIPRSRDKSKKPIRQGRLLNKGAAIGANGDNWSAAMTLAEFAFIGAGRSSNTGLVPDYAFVLW